MTNATTTKNNLIAQFLLKISEKVKSSDLTFIRDQLQSVLYNYSVDEIKSTEIVSLNNGQATKNLFEYYRVGKLSAGMSEKSLEQYKIAVTQLCDFVHKDLNLITTEDIRYFLVEYANPNKNPEGKAIKGSTMDGKRRCLSSVFDYLFRNKRIAENPMLQVDRIKYKKTIKRPLNETEIEEVKIGCEKYGRNRIRNYAMLLFMIDTGLRVSEISNIELSDIDFDKMTVKALGKGNKERFVYFTGRTKIRLREYMKTRKDVNIYACDSTNISNIPLFASSRAPYKNLSPRAIEDVLTMIGKKTGIHIHPHLMRATGATLWHKNGMPIDMCADLLGHSNLNTVMTYVKNSPDQMQAEYRKLGNIA